MSVLYFEVSTLRFLIKIWENAYYKDIEKMKNNFFQNIYLKNKLTVEGFIGEKQVLTT